MPTTPSYSYEDLQRRRAQLQSFPLTLDIYDWYMQMQASHDVYYDEARASWLVFRYDDVMRLVLDTVTFSSELATRPDGSVDADSGVSLVTMDPPRHRQLRTLVSQVFTAQAIAQFEPRIREIVGDLLDRVQDQGEIDVIDDLAFPLPAMVIAEILGIPNSDRDQFYQWAVDFTSPDFALQQATSIKIGEYFGHIIEERQKDPREDLVSHLVHVEIDGERMSIPDLLGICLLLLLAGHDTTMGLIGNALVCLDEHPQAQRELVEQPELLPSAIEEVLRYRAVVHGVPRFAKVDTVFCGQKMKAGDLVTPLYASANLGETKFPNANTFDIRRSPNRHLGFGHGIHFCLGAPLARLEARIALAMLLERFPNIHRKREVPLELNPSWIIYKFKHLPFVLA